MTFHIIHTIGCTKYLPKKLIQLCEEVDGECKTCLGSNCNTEKSFKKCLYCTTADGWECAAKPQGIKSKTCKTYNSDCFTYIGIQGVSRGCIDDESTTFANICKENPNKCSICNTDDGNGCNDEKILLDHCVECDSRTGDKCRENPDLYGNKICTDMKTVSQKVYEFCYMRVVSISTFSSKINSVLNTSLISRRMVMFNEAVYVIWIQKPNHSVKIIQTLVKHALELIAIKLIISKNVLNAIVKMILCVRETQR